MWRNPMETEKTTKATPPLPSEMFASTGDHAHADISSLEGVFGTVTSRICLGYVMDWIEEEEE